MGLAKNKKLLAEGKISQVEFNRRKSQSNASSGKFNRQVLQNFPQRAKAKVVAAPSPVTRVVTIPRQVYLKPGKQRMAMAKMTHCDKKALAYVACMMDPSRHYCRIPDVEDRPTFLYRSRRILKIGAEFTPGSVNDGRFSVIVSPILGDYSSPQSYQIAISDVTAANWNTTDWTQTTSWKGASSAGDPRIDENAVALTSPQVGTAIYVGGGTLSAANPLGSAPTADNDSFDPDRFLVTANGTDNLVTLPLGTWSITISAAGTGLAGYSFTASTVTVVTVGVNINTTTNQGVTLLVKSIPGSQVFAFRLSAATTVTSSFMVINAGASSTESWNQDCGILTRMRPVACQALLTFTNAVLDDGGDVAAALLPGGDKDDNFFALRGNNLNLFQNWEDLAKVNVNSYNGPLRNGACVRWRPDITLNDLQLRTPSEANVANYPYIAISGRYKPQQNPTGSVDFAKLEVVTVWEMVTSSNLFESQKHIGSTAIVEKALGCLANIPVATANDTHDEWYDTALRNVDQFFDIADHTIDRTVDTGRRAWDRFLEIFM